MESFTVVRVLVLTHWHQKLEGDDIFSHQRPFKKSTAGRVDWSAKVGKAWPKGSTEGVSFPPQCPLRRVSRDAGYILS